MSWAYELTLGSPAQKAVLIALCDHADEQNSCYPSIARLVARTEFCEKTVRVAIQALEKAGLVRTSVHPGKSSRYLLAVGKNPGNSYTPVTDTGHPGNRYRTPRQELPDNPVAATDKPSRTVIEPSGNRQSRVPAREEQPTLPDWLPPEAWAEWCEYRRKLKAKGWTQMAARKSLASLSQLRDDGHDPREVIDQSIAAGWTGLFAVKQSRPNGQASSKLGWLHDDPMFDRSKP